MPTGQPVTFGDIPLCLTSPGSAAITSVSLTGVKGNVTLDAFAVRTKTNHHDDVGNPHQTLASIDGFDPSAPQVVTQVCLDPSKMTWDDPAAWESFVELAVQVTRRSDELAGGHGLYITYEAGGAQGTYHIPFGLFLCPASCEGVPWEFDTSTPARR